MAILEHSVTLDKTSPVTRRRFIVLPVVLLLLAAGAGSSGAATFNVTTTTDRDSGACNPGDCALREAIDAANASFGTSTIDVPAGTYVLSIGASLDLEFSSVTIVGAGSNSTIIDGNQLVGVFNMSFGTFEMDGVTVQNGLDATGDGGGGILVTDSDFTSTDLVITNCVTNGPGGALFNNDSAVYLTDVTFTDNQAVTGGGLANETGSTYFDGSYTINGNTATAEGGGVWNSLGSVYLDNSNQPAPTTGGGTISSNQSGTNGGAIYADGDRTQIQNATLDSNQATGDGGGIWNSPSTSTYVTNVTISNSNSGATAAPHGTAASWNSPTLRSRPTLPSPTAELSGTIRIC